MSDLHLAIKDVQHGIDTAKAVGTRLKVAEVAIENLKRARDYSEAHSGRALDSSSLYGIVREDAGLDFRNDIVRARPEEEAQSPRSRVSLHLCFKSSVHHCNYWS
jgi:hypothetical protein